MLKCLCKLQRKVEGQWVVSVGGVGRVFCFHYLVSLYVMCDLHAKHTHRERRSTTTNTSTVVVLLQCLARR